MKGRTHSPHTATGRSKAQIVKSSEPRGIVESWPSEGGLNAPCSDSPWHGIPRRAAKPTNPNCVTTKHMWGMVARWRRDNESPDLVRTRLDDNDVTVRAAAFQYLKAMEK